MVENELDRKSSQIKGLVTESGGPLSHGMIAAREVGLPAVCGVEGVVENIGKARSLVLDSEKGVVQVANQ